MRAWLFAGSALLLALSCTGNEFSTTPEGDAGDTGEGGEPASGGGSDAGRAEVPGAGANAEGGSEGNVAGAGVVVEGGSGTGEGGSGTVLLPLAVFSELRGPDNAGVELVAVSADGRYVAGHVHKTLLQAVRWADTVPLELGAFENGNGNYATDISADGSVVVGFSETLIGRSAFMYDGEFNELSPLVRAQSYYAEANAVSGDGKLVAGISTNLDGNSVPVQWLAGSIQQLPVLAEHGLDTPSAMNLDGSLIVGTGQTKMDSHYEAVRWPANGILSLGLSHSEALDVSSDGKYVVGTHNPAPAPGAPKRLAFRWSATAGVEFLPKAPGDAVDCAANATSGDGSIVAVYCTTYSMNSSTPSYYLWAKERGLFPIEDLLMALGVDTSVYVLGGATDISADGTTIIGTATKGGLAIGWRAIIDSQFP